ncbi:hypothetical protein HK101_003619 [Irineochytrium annulatum]|nr:hypothetical protein HK101_003619 [Irineochytrium annulatum]
MLRTGLMGLAYASISNIASASASSNTNFIDALNLSPNEFGFYLSNAADSDEGEFTLGGTDPSRHTGEFTYIPLNSKTYWQASFSGATYAIGSKTGSLVGPTTNFISDTGTTLIILDTAPANAINAAIGASSSGEISCSVAKTGPAVTFNFGGGSFAIPASIYVIDDGSGAGTCISGFASGAADAGVVILGDIFSRAWYTVYDKANSRIGYALAVHGTVSSPPTSTPPMSSTPTESPSSPPTPTEPTPSSSTPSATPTPAPTGASCTDGDSRCVAADGESDLYQYCSGNEWMEASCLDGSSSAGYDDLDYNNQDGSVCFQSRKYYAGCE